MSKPIAVHADGTNCYTKNCKRRNVGSSESSLISSLTAKLNDLDAKLVEVRPVKYLVDEIREELASIYVEPGFAWFVNVEGIQQKINFLAGSEAGGKALRAELKQAEAELAAFKKSHYHDYSDEAGRLGRVARLRVGAWKRGLYLHEDKLIPGKFTYRLAYSTEDGFEDVIHTSNIEDAIKLDGYSSYTMNWGPTELNIEGIRSTSAQGLDRELVFVSKNEELRLNLGDYQVDGRRETDLAELLPL